MVRDVADDKVDYSLVADGPMLKRLAAHLTKGARKYSPRNWMKASGQAELDRFRESAFRHFMQWYYGETDEDHAAAVYFNINGAEYVKDQRAEEVGESFTKTSDRLLKHFHDHLVEKPQARTAQGFLTNRTLLARKAYREVAGEYPPLPPLPSYEVPDVRGRDF
jgi:hypothetical protein